MDSDEIDIEIPSFIRLYKDGRFQKLAVTNIVPAGTDPSSGVQSKDIVFSPETGLFARLYIPESASPNHKLPLLIYYHGGGFIIETAASLHYHNFLNAIVSESNIAVVSVDYRTAPEFPLPVAYDDSWEAIKWVAEHADGSGAEAWLNEHADLQNVFLAGDSAGGNIAHQMAIRVGSGNLRGMKFRGCILLHPFFWGKELVGTESERSTPELLAIMKRLWGIVHPGSSGADDPLINPGADPSVSGLGCPRVLVFVAEKDFIKDRGWYYKDVMEKSGWTGELEVIEHNGVGHVFFLFDPSDENTCALRTKICTFINGS